MLLLFVKETTMKCSKSSRAQVAQGEPASLSTAKPLRESDRIFQIHRTMSLSVFRLHKIRLRHHSRKLCLGFSSLYGDLGAGLTDVEV